MTDDELTRFCADAYPKLLGALTHQFGDRWLAEELAQDALIRVCDHWSPDAPSQLQADMG